jgi:hypothetical protein
MSPQKSIQRNETATLAAVKWQGASNTHSVTSSKADIYASPKKYTQVLGSCVYRDVSGNLMTTVLKTNIDFYGANKTNLQHSQATRQENA